MFGHRFTTLIRTSQITSTRFVTENSYYFLIIAAKIHILMWQHQHMGCKVSERNPILSKIRSVTLKKNDLPKNSKDYSIINK